MKTPAIVWLSLLVAMVVLATIAMLFAKSLGNTLGVKSESSTYVIEQSESDIVNSKPMVPLEIIDSGIKTVEDDGPRVMLKDSLPRFTEQLAEVHNKNEEALAWLNIPNTDISYPVVINKSHYLQNGELDREWYLRRSVYNEAAPDYNEKSAIYADSRGSLESEEDIPVNTILYGHNWTNVESGGSKLKVVDPRDKMFAQLPSFANLEFAQDTTYFTLDLEDTQLVFVIFAAMYVDTYNPNNKTGYYYLDTNPSPRDLDFMLTEARERSEHIYRVPVGVNDKFLTLSTCTLKYGSNPNQRFVVMGKLLGVDEDISDYPPPIRNPAPKRPNV